MGNIVIKAATGDPHVVASKPYDLEALLQENIGDLPQLIQLEEAIGESVQLWTIGKEISVESGAIDILMLGSDGILTIVETKLAKNPGSRREVVGQVLEYAAHAADWAIEDVSRIVANSLGKPFETALEDFLSQAKSESSVSELRALIEDNIRAGKLRLVIAADSLLETVRKTITFVNRNSNFDILLLQITCYEEPNGTRIYVPSLHGYAQRVKASLDKPLWQPTEGDQNLVARLEAIVTRGDWQLRTHYYSKGVDFRSDNYEWALGVEHSARHGTQLYLWSKDASFPYNLSGGVERRFTPNYTFIYGELDNLSDEQIAEMFNWALANSDRNG